jgi:hypothetical protein
MEKKNSDQATDFCEAVDIQMKVNTEFHEKVKQERILKNDTKEQVSLLKTNKNKRRK